MSIPNLSALAVRERAITLFLIVASACAGIYAYVQLGRAEDPSFTIKVLTVTAVWPGATPRRCRISLLSRWRKDFRNCAGMIGWKLSRGRGWR